MKRKSSRRPSRGPRSLRDHATETVQIGIISALAICIVAFALLGSVSFKPGELPNSGAEVRPIDWTNIPIEHLAPPPPPRKIGEIVEASDGDTSTSLPDINLPDSFAVIPGQDKLDLTLDGIGYTPLDGTYPQIISGLDIIYPDHLRARGIEGLVVVLVGLDENGSIFDARIYKSSGYAALDSLALQNVCKARFTPAMQGNKPIAVKARVPIKFSLDR